MGELIMRKDPKNFRERFKHWKETGEYLQPGSTLPDTSSVESSLPGYASGKPTDPPTPQTTGGAGYVPPLKSYPNIQSVPTMLRNRFYSKIHPDDTYNVKDFVGNFLGTSYRGEQDGDVYYAWKRVFDANDKFYPNDEDNKLNRIKADIGDEMLATYLNIPIKNRHSDIRFTKSKYDNNAYALPLPDQVKQSIIEQTRNNKIGTNVAGQMGIFLGTSSLGRGYDSKGEYRSYGDSYDLNPFKGKWQVANIPMLSDIEDLTLGVGKPFNVYDRIYLNDYYGVPSDTKGLYLPEVIVKPKK